MVPCCCRAHATNNTTIGHCAHYGVPQVGEERGRRAAEARFQSVMARHRERIYILEKEKRLIEATPAADIEEWEAKRHKAAAMVQAWWRGHQQRKAWAAQGPARLKKQAEAAAIQKAYKELMALKGQGQAQSGTGQAGGEPPSVRQSATVLMGSPAKGVGDAPGASTGGFGLASELGYGPASTQRPGTATSAAAGKGRTGFGLASELGLGGEQAGTQRAQGPGVAQSGYGLAAELGAQHRDATHMSSKRCVREGCDRRGEPEHASGTGCGAVVRAPLSCRAVCIRIAWI